MQISNYFINHTNKFKCSSWKEKKLKHLFTEFNELQGDNKTDNGIWLTNEFESISTGCKNFYHKYKETIKVLIIDYFMKDYGMSVLDHSRRGYQHADRTLFLVSLYTSGNSEVP